MWNIGSRRLQEARLADGAMPIAANGQIEYAADRGTQTAPYGWDDLVAPASAVNPPGGVSAAVYNATDCTFDFADGLTRRLDFVYQMPHRWLEGSSAYFHVHVGYSSVNAGNVRWRYAYRVWANDGAKPAFTTADVTKAAAESTAHKRVDFGEISLAGTTISTIVQIQLTRLGSDAADTYTGTVQLISADLHYQSDVMTGSTQEWTK